MERAKLLLQSEYRITMKIQPPNKIQLIFHRGAKVIEQPKSKLIREDFGMLIWKENDIAIMCSKTYPIYNILN